MMHYYEIILRWAYSELTSSRFRYDMKYSGITSDLFNLADDGVSFDEAIAGSIERQIALFMAIYNLRSGNIAMLRPENHELESWTKDDVLALRVVPANGGLSIEEYIEVAPTNHPQDARALVLAMTDAGLKSLPDSPGIIGWNGSDTVLLDGTFRTLARLSRGDIQFPMWTPVSLSRRKML